MASIVFSYEETRALEEDYIFFPLTTPGKRKISGALLSPPANQGSGSLSSSSSSSASVRYKSFNSSTNFTLDLPQSAVSVEALEFIGFTTQTADEIFARFTSRPNPDNNHDDLIDYVYGHVRILTTEAYQHYATAQAIAQIGLTQQVQDAITDPRFSTILGTETLYFWVKDTLRINYLTLIQLQCRLKNHATRSLAKKKAKRPKIEDVFQPAASLSTEQNPQTATLNMTSEDHNLPKHYVTVQHASPVLQNHYVLYKAKAASEMGELQWICDDGSLEMNAIASYAAGDFNHQNPAWYWTPEAETAEEYRAWAARRCPYSDTWVIRIQIPEIFINGLRQQDLWYSQNWKEYVWYCKKRMRPPPKYDLYWKAGGADLIKGHICTGFSASVTRIKKDEVQTKMSEENLLTIGSSKATQWVFMQDDSVERLGREIRGKIHIEITAAKEAQEN